MRFLSQYCDIFGVLMTKFRNFETCLLLVDLGCVLQTLRYWFFRSNKTFKYQDCASSFNVQFSSFQTKNQHWIISRYGTGIWIRPWISKLFWQVALSLQKLSIQKILFIVLLLRIFQWIRQKSFYTYQTTTQKSDWYLISTSKDHWNLARDSILYPVNKFSIR